jgi:glycosyltransferase involved in cell wall biosynthesis
MDPVLSIVVPVFNEAGNIRKLHSELIPVLEKLGVDWEIIFCDDGSDDATWEIIDQLHRDNERIKGIRFSRNFGHQYALFAGMQHASGKAVITMDGDLQHPPELLPEMLERWRAGDKIVHTVRVYDQKQGFIKKLSSNLFYRLFTFLSGVEMEGGMADFRLLDRQVLDELLKFKEEGLFLRGLVHWVGYQSSKLTFQCGQRFSGKGKYSLKKMLKLAWTGITSFSIVPLRVSIIIGVLTSLLAFAEMLYAIYAKLFTDTVVPGWASGVAVVSFLFGILFIMLGVLGEYMGRVLIESRGRPRFLISERVGVTKD